MSNPTVQPMYQYGVADVVSGQSIDLGNAISIGLDGSSSYSIGVWIRLHSAGNTGTLLQKGTELALTLNGAVPSAAMAGQTSPLASSVPLSLDEWHYLLLTYAAGADSSTMTLYLDGASVGEASLSGVGSASQSDHFVLGGSIDAEFMSACFWSEAVAVTACGCQWTPPEAGTTLAACFDFTSGTANDASGNNNPITFLGGAQQYWVNPGLLLQNSALQPNTAETFNTGGASAKDPFSLHAWVYPEAPTPEYGNVMVVFANGQFTGPGGIAAYLSYQTSTQTFLWNLQRGGAKGTVLTASQLPIAPNTWHHVAATYDGTKLSLYVDGQLGASITSEIIRPLSQPAMVIGAAPLSGAAGGLGNSFNGYVQALGLWSTALTADQITTYMTMDPSAETGCVAFYSFAVEDNYNEVSGLGAYLLNTAALEEVRTPFPAAAATVVTGKRVRKAEITPAASLHAFAAARRKELTAAPLERPVTPLMSAEKMDAITADYERFLVGLPSAEQQRLRQRFQQNLYLGFHLKNAAKGPLPGTVTSTRVGDDFVFHHHTETGPVECLRVPAAQLDACTAWKVSVIATAIGTLLSAMGVAYAATKLGAIVLIKVIYRVPSEILGALMAEEISAAWFIKVVQTIYNTGALTSVLAGALSGLSWWNWAFTVASLVVNIFGIWVSGGLYTFVLLAELALGVAQLVELIQEKPTGC